MHRPGSWHADGLAADLNHGSNGPIERAQPLIALGETEQRGLAITYARDGTAGSAGAHQNHLHVDVGEWSNLGRGLVRRSPPTRSPAGAAARPAAPGDPVLHSAQARLNRDYPAY